MWFDSTYVRDDDGDMDEIVPNDAGFRSGGIIRRSCTQSAQVIGYFCRRVRGLVRSVCPVQSISWISLKVLSEFA